MPVELAKLSFWRNQKFLRKKEKSLINRKRRGVHSFYQKVISSAVINSTIVPYQSNPWQYSSQDFCKELPLPSEEIHSLDETLSQSTQRLRQDTLINMLASKPKLITKLFGDYIDLAAGSKGALSVMVLHTNRETDPKYYQLAGTLRETTQLA